MSFKNDDKIKEIGEKFQFEGVLKAINSYGFGLINQTFKLSFETSAGTKSYLLQQVNCTIFKQPEIIGQNIKIVGQHLAQKDYPRSYLQLVNTLENTSGYKEDNTFWRAFHFIEDTKVYNEALNPEIAYQAAKGFSEFNRHLSDLSATKIKPAIPNFHDFKQRLSDFRLAKKLDKKNRRKFIKKEIAILDKYIPDYENFMRLKLNEKIVHGDSKINNLLFFNDLHIVKSVIDYDTLLPSSYLIDLGDMVRTMACSHSEEAQEMSEIHLDEKKFESIILGFKEELYDFLNDTERNHLILASRVVIMIQVIRFLTDYLNGDTYYKIAYPEHNLIRAKNQLTLLLDLIRKIKL